MKKPAVLFIIFALFITAPEISFAQYKSDTGKPNISGILNSQPGSYLFGIIDPSKMQMHHSASISYGSYGAGAGMALSTYVNTIDYRFSENLFLRTNLGIMNSPYNTFGNEFFLNKPQFYGSAQLNYKLNDKTQFMLRVESSPFMYYRPGYSSQFYYDDPFR